MVARPTLSVLCGAVARSCCQEARWGARSEDPRAWAVPAEGLIRTDAEGRVLAVNLDLKNPNAVEAEDHRTPAEIVSGMVAREAQVLDLLREIEALVAERA